MLTDFVFGGSSVSPGPVWVLEQLGPLTRTSRGRAKPPPSGAFLSTEDGLDTCPSGTWDVKHLCGCWGSFAVLGASIRAGIPLDKGTGAHLWRKWKGRVGTEALWALLSSSAVLGACEGLCVEPRLLLKEPRTPAGPAGEGALASRHNPSQSFLADNALPRNQA